MNVAIIGLGYTGTVTAACLARMGHRIAGVDVDEVKTDAFGRGEPTFAEPGLVEALRDAAQRGLLHAEPDARRAAAWADVVIVCVGTPSGPDGQPDLASLLAVAEQVGAGLAQREPDQPCCIVVRSTVPPGTMRQRFIPAVQAAAGAAHGEGWTCAYSPEFIREGSALADFADPPQTVIGADDPAHAAAYLECIAAVDAPVRDCTIELAEFVKYACNAFHATKVTFANEIGAIARALGVDGRRAMELVCNDRVLNISPAYLKPGNAFGGSCLPKDLRALTQLAETRGLVTPLLRAVMPANDAQIDRLVEVIRQAGHRRVGFVGLAFKHGTDDLRESPVVLVVKQLLSRGFEVRAYDPQVDLDVLRGRNRDIFLAAVPEASRVLSGNLDDLLAMDGTLVLARPLDPSQLERAHAQRIVDLVGHPYSGKAPPTDKPW